MSSSETSVSQNNNSLNENRVESKEDNYRRDSFDDRFCDDLSEVMLQFLSLEDKLKLEGVSKQFQRTVLKKHYELTIETKYITKRKLEKQYKYLLNENLFIDLKSLEVLLKKCPNITSIELRAVHAGIDYNEVFRLITK